MQTRILGGPFRGARVGFDARRNKRKVAGVFEWQLNGWWRKELARADFFWDVGANDGYYTWGVAHVLQGRGGGAVLAFEPDRSLTSILEAEGLRGRLPKVSVQVFWKEVGGKAHRDEVVSLDSVLESLGSTGGRRHVVKIDVEGAELEVLSGASRLLGESSSFLVETHGEKELAGVTEIFRSRGRLFEVVRPRAHWLFGPESRQFETPWVITTD